jgi:pimeloyl-ACP methyl ester carboxylesterase
MSDNGQTSTLSEINVGQGNESRKIAVMHSNAPSNTDQSMASADQSMGCVWLGGYRSDMEGSKAVALDLHAQNLGLACTRHDYSGHGQSGGAFIDGTISRWLEESMKVFTNYTKGPQVLVGSSMGAWIALRMVQELKKRGELDRVKALLLLAPAPDFTKELYEPKLTDLERTALLEKGYFEVPTPYGPDPNIFTKKLFDDGEKNLVLQGVMDLGVPVHIIQGMADPDVPWQHAMKLMEHLPSEDVVITLIKDGDHRLSRDRDIAKMLQMVDGLIS